MPEGSKFAAVAVGFRKSVLWLAQLDGTTIEAPLKVP